jgi:hypothetical protein
MTLTGTTNALNQKAGEGNFWNTFVVRPIQGMGNAIGTAFDDDPMTQGGYRYEGVQTTDGKDGGTPTYTTKRTNLTTGKTDVVAAPQSVIESEMGPGHNAMTPQTKQKQDRADRDQMKAEAQGQENQRQRLLLAGRGLDVDTQNANTNTMNAETSAESVGVNRLQAEGGIQANNQSYQVNMAQLGQSEYDRVLKTQEMKYNQMRQNDLDKDEKAYRAMNFAAAHQREKRDNMTAGFQNLANAFFSLKNGG